jgi:Fe2+ or Zn2+ uptake regulation protein
MTRDGEPRRRSKLRFQLLNLFVDCGISEAKLTPSAVAVWLVLYRHAREDRTVSVTVEEIERASSLGRKTVFRALKELKTKAMLKTITKGGINRGANLYRIFPVPASKP